MASLVVDLEALDVVALKQIDKDAVLICHNSEFFVALHFI